METVSFCSYKGGVGRTTAVANIAMFLARLGKKVVVLDLDFFAPGIPSKILQSQYHNVETGFVDFVLEYLRNDAVPDTFDSFGIPVRLPLAPKKWIKNSEGELEGGLYLIPAGNTSSRENYWRIVTPGMPQASPGSRPDARIVTLSEQFSGMFNVCHCTEEQIRFFSNDLKNAVSKWDPDYLLIDCPAGITPFAGPVNLLMADTVICLFGMSSENLAGTRQLFERLLESNIIRNQINTEGLAPPP